MDILNSRNTISSQVTTSANTTNANESTTQQYVVIDINTKMKTITLSDLIDTDHLIEDIKINKDLFIKIKEKYELINNEIEIIVTIEKTNNNESQAVSDYKPKIIKIICQKVLSSSTSIDCCNSDTVNMSLSQVEVENNQSEDIQQEILYELLDR